MTQPTNDPAVGQPPTEPAPQPPAPPQPAAQPPAPQPGPPPASQQPGQPTFVAPVPPAGQPAPRAATSSGNAVDPATGEDLGYPANTPQTEMSADQQIAYWKHKARGHEARNKAMGDYDALKETAEKYQQLVAASQTDHERAVAEANRQGYAKALAEAGGQLVEQWVRAAAAGRLPQESVDALLLGLDRSRFINPNGGVDTDKVYAFVGSLAPAAAPAAGPAQPGQQGGTGTAQQPPQQQTQPLIAAPPRAPDFGQGQPQTPTLTGLAAGAEIARARFAKTGSQPK